MDDQDRSIFIQETIMTKITDTVRDQAAATCTTPADFKALARYDRLIKEAHDAQVSIMGQAYVDTDQELDRMAALLD